MYDNENVLVWTVVDKLTLMNIPAVFLIPLPGLIFNAFSLKSDNQRSLLLLINAEYFIGQWWWIITEDVFGMCNRFLMMETNIKYQRLVNDDPL